MMICDSYANKLSDLQNQISTFQPILTTKGKDSNSCPLQQVEYSEQK